MSKQSRKKRNPTLPKTNEPYIVWSTEVSHEGLKLRALTTYPFSSPIDAQEAAFHLARQLHDQHPGSKMGSDVPTHLAYKPGTLYRVTYATEHEGHVTVGIATLTELERMRANVRNDPTVTHIYHAPSTNPSKGVN